MSSGTAVSAGAVAAFRAVGRRAALRTSAPAAGRVGSAARSRPDFFTRKLPRRASIGRIRPEVRTAATVVGGAEGGGGAGVADGVRLVARTPEDMEAVGSVLSGVGIDPVGEGRQHRRRLVAGRGDCILLVGDLGSGKSVFSRGFVRARTCDPHLRVTSPTFLLDNTYRAPAEEDLFYDDGDEEEGEWEDGDEEEDGDEDTDGSEYFDDEPVTIHHMDLYRLSDDVDGELLEPLGLPYILSKCISLIEWPRLGPHMPDDRLEVHFGIDGEAGGLVEGNDLVEGEEFRRIILYPFGKMWEDRVGDVVSSGALDPYLDGSGRDLVAAAADGSSAQ